MRSGEVRKLAQAAAEEGADPALWAAIAARCDEYAERLQYWDAVLILQAFTAARVEHRPLFLRLAEALSSKTSRLAPKHVLDLLAVYEAHGLRPRALYVELFHTLIRLSRSMYAEELSLSLQALARYNLGNPTVITHLVRTVRQQLSDFRLRYLCGVTGALGAMQACPAPLLAELDARALLEVQTIPLQELLDNMQAFPLMEFSWRPYEDQCLEELLARTRTFATAQDMDQFVDPFEALRFLQARGALHDDFLKSLCQWCLLGVHKPNVRSERRPTARQLVVLYDHCHERNMEQAAALKDALQYYVESAGGKWQRIMPKPLMYHKTRDYLRSDDPLQGIELPALPAAGSQPRLAQRRDNELPGLPSSNTEASLWPLEDAPAESSDDLVPSSASTAVVPRKKLSASSPELGPDETTVRCWVRSRKSVRPRHRPDRGLKKMLRKDMPRGPLWYHGGWETRPKYQQGTPTKNYPWAGVPTGHNGAKRILRR